MEYMIQVEHVSKSFREETVLHDITINFEKGKIYGIVGKNGSGKTMLFKTIAGFVKPTSGHVYVDGKEIGKDTDFAPSLGIIIETPGFLGHYSAYENLAYLAGIRNRIGKEQIMEAIRLVGLEHAGKKKVGRFSLGMRQRLGIAQAIMENPELVILDEPMNGLDTEGICLVKELLLNLKKEGKTILLASHYVEDMEICDEVLHMEKGKLEVH